MADLLIKGMDMPKDGRKHTALIQFQEDGTCRAIVEYSESYSERSIKVFPCEVIPEGIRLIDANMVVLAKFSGDREGRYSEYQRGWNDALDTIKKNAPSFIQPENKPAEAQTTELQACPYCKQKPTIRKWGRIYRAECEQYACNNPYAANVKTPEDCAECWNTFVAQIEKEQQKSKSEAQEGEKQHE